MKRVIIIVLTVAMILTAASALADIVICQNKVEIAGQMEAFARLYEEKPASMLKLSLAADLVTTTLF